MNASDAAATTATGTPSESAASRRARIRRSARSAGEDMSITSARPAKLA